MITIRPAERADLRLMMDFIRELAEYEKLLADVVATEAMIGEALFTENPRVFCDIAAWNGENLGFSLWFYNFSTFRGRAGIYLEDLYVRPEGRGKGLGKALLKQLAKRCVDENLARFEWSVLDWNAPSIAFYQAMGAILLDSWTTCRVTGNALEQLAKSA